MQLNEFFGTLDPKLSKYADWLREWDSLSKEDKIKNLPRIHKLVDDAAEDYWRMKEGKNRLHGDSYEKMLAYNSYCAALLGEE